MSLGGLPGFDAATTDLVGTAPLEGLWDVLDAAPLVITVTSGAQHQLVWRNRLALELYGERESRPLAELFPESAEALELWDRALRGEVITVTSQLVAPVDVVGRQRIMRCSMGPVRDAHGAIIGVIQFAADVTTEVDAGEIAHRAKVLADITTAQAGQPDAEGALQAIADTLVPGVADLAAIYVFDRPTSGSSEAFVPIALAYGGAIGHAGLPPRPRRRARLSRWEHLLTAGIPVAVSLDEVAIAQLDPHPDMRAWLARADATSMALAPLVVGGQLTGGVLLLGVGDRRRYDERDIDFLRDITTRAGLTIAEIRSRQRDREAVHRLQHALLPTHLPAVRRAQAAARYLPSSADYVVGGDWWDLIDLDQDRVALAIGDISGHGLSAAALMGQARVAMRTAARAGLPPAEILTLLDAELAAAIAEQEDADLDLHRFATALYAVTTSDRSRLRIASAGHLPLLVRPAHGATHAVWTPPDPPLGLGEGRYRETIVELHPGDTIVAFTDGLVEDRRLPATDGIDRLSALLDSISRHHDLETVADTILSSMGRSNDPTEDDLALVVLRLDAD